MLREIKTKTIVRSRIQAVENTVKEGVELDIGASLAIPRRGHVLSTTAEIYGKDIRESVSMLANTLKANPLLSEVMYARGAEIECGRAAEEMAAWNMVAIWVTAVATKALLPSSSLASAEQWFFGCKQISDLIPSLVIKLVEDQLRNYANASAYLHLMPYILDPHGPGSRLSVRRDPDTDAARKRKRAEGVFYTPTDVADYMVGACLSDVEKDSMPTVFDPACGTGVFLRAALKELSKKNPNESAYSLASKCLFGVDIDPWPIDAVAYVLLVDSWDRSLAESMRPIDAWRQLRRNLATIDAIRIDPVDVTGSNRSARTSISTLFPALRNGPKVVLGNPPYADIGARSDVADLGRNFESLKIRGGASAEIYLAFIEQMIRLSDRSSSAGALVLPLSLACNVGNQFAQARELIARSPGRWSFAFFDREPHALFGEDVKTRNSIVIWSRNQGDSKAHIRTGPLQKWRGEARAEMFKKIRFTEIDVDIRMGIPKVDGRFQANALRTLNSRWRGLGQVIQGIERVELAHIPNSNEQTVFVGATAYNFLNVFLAPPQNVLCGRASLSEHPLYSLACSSSRDAFVVFAILSSHLAYWWWHAHGDGFHVSRRFLADFPFDIEDMSAESVGSVAAYGELLWDAIKAKPIMSLNKGSTSLAYSPNGHNDLRRNIDEKLANILGLEREFVSELQQFALHATTATLRACTATAVEESAIA